MKKHNWYDVLDTSLTGMDLIRDVIRFYGQNSGDFQLDMVSTSPKTGKTFGETVASGKFGSLEKVGEVENISEPRKRWDECRIKSRGTSKVFMHNGSDILTKKQVITLLQYYRIYNCMPNYDFVLLDEPDFSKETLAGSNYWDVCVLGAISKEYSR